MGLWLLPQKEHLLCSASIVLWATLTHLSQMYTPLGPAINLLTKYSALPQKLHRISFFLLKRWIRGVADTIDSLKFFPIVGANYFHR